MNQINNTEIHSQNLVYASEHEEFFYKSDDSPVQQGEPVGVEIEKQDSIDLVLFADIYWSDQNLY